MTPYLAFTTTYNGKSNKLISEAHIIYNGEDMYTNKALWDTGATQSCISHAVVSRLGLIPFSQTMMCGASGMKVCNVYLVDVVLRNNVTVKDIHVIEAELDNQNIDMLIGMDIIGLGDFAVTNVNGITKFTFRLPSVEEIDFVKQIQDQCNTPSQ